MKVLWIVIPCYNEGGVLLKTYEIFLSKLHSLIEKGKVSDESRICFVNDGSLDDTWEEIKSLTKKETHIVGMSLSRNRGHQNALLAGLMEAKDHCDVTVSIDCDGQDDINAIDEMIDKYLSGVDIVYGVRSERKTDSFFKRHTAQMYYKLLSFMGVETVYNHADYRLISKKALEALSLYKEVNLFLRGLTPLLGFQSDIVYYEREKRVAGKSHYPLSKMMHLATDGITSLSIRPLRIAVGFGIFFSLLGLVGVLWAIIVFFLGKAIAGWASLICIMCFIGGIQLFCLGIIGEYIGKIYLETKERPRFIVSERTWEDNEIGDDK